MRSDSLDTELSSFLEKALGVQSAETEKPLSEERLKEIALNAGLTEEDWENLCKNLKDHLAKGRNFLKFGNYTDAIEELEGAVAIAPYRADVLVDCGKAHHGQWKDSRSRTSRDRAETLFRKGLEIDPGNAGAAEYLSELKNPKPAPRPSRKFAAIAAAMLLAGGAFFWMGTGLSGKSDAIGEPVQIDVPNSGDPASPTVYSPAALPTLGSPAPLPFDGDLVAHWAFDGSSPGEDSAEGKRGLTKSGTVEGVNGVYGGGLHFSSEGESAMYSDPSPDLNLVETITVSAWVKPTERTSSQVVWFGDRRSGHDPWMLSILDNGQVQFRSDRSVTGPTDFTVRPEETLIKTDGTPQLSQHVATDSPGLLPLNEWSFISGRIRETPSGESIISVFVNGVLASEVKTNETIDYDTDGMWACIGAAHKGNAQNFDGMIDEVRIYRTALSDDEIQELYRHPRQNGAED